MRRLLLASLSTCAVTLVFFVGIALPLQALARSALS